MNKPELILPPSLEYALRIKHRVTGTGWEQWYLLTSDGHWDSPECYLKLLRRHLAQAKERNALVIDLGDWFDAINSRDDPRGSKGGIRLEHVKLNYLDWLIESAVEEFAEFADLFAYMGTGNHEQAITVRRETDITARFIERLNARRSNGLPGIHRAGYTGWVRFQFEQQNARLSHSMKCEHGTGGNSPVTRGTIQANRRASRTEGATFFASGHIHEQWDLSAPIETLNQSTGRIEQRNVKHLQLGSYKADFRNDGVATWAMMKMGSPKPIGGKWLRFYCPRNKEIAFEVTDTEVDYPNLSSYLVKSKPVRIDEAVA